ncbi:hypothetical protein BDQ12DRAFT_672830 [Crucibulum laeve]|uniref:PH domain-containing protein n=1 Tax=Crucibulum laeve TaxID=68775 RepID=A0A5C3MG59_9AGAR|nr:hypothetical protein BDQ12DRAFT_672830 [Crucibulum laeve]
MASHKSPLRDRLLSNSPDPMKSSILRESGMGWNSPPSSTMTASNTGSITSPLRIAKRDSPARQRAPNVARRSSSSFKHVRNNNLVSKSPFKSQIPTPSTPSRTPIVFPTRRVSGEKRPRPPSLHEQAENENERPFSLKRERKQSKGFQGLIEKEPVSKSPFKVGRIPSAEDVNSSVPPVPFISRVAVPSYAAPIATSSHIPVPATEVDNRPSPSRSSLVSKRMHGPRLSGGARRERRKTVTFDERCDVLEFDRDDSIEDVFESADEDDNYGMPEPDIHNDDDNDPFFQASAALEHEYHHDDVMDEDASYESIQLSDVDADRAVPSLLTLDPDASITGLVDEMFSSSGAGHFLPNTSIGSATSTPPRHSDIPTDLEAEDGVPFGRSHHVERFLQHHQQPQLSPHQQQQPPHFSPHQSPHQSPQPSDPPQHGSPARYPFNLNLPTAPSPLGPPATPPRRSPGIQYSTPPLGRSTHIERIKKAREEERLEDVEEDVAMLPGSPSPVKKSTSSASSSMIREEGLIPKFDISGASRTELEQDVSANIYTDPFAIPRLQDERPLNQSGEVSMDPANLSIGQSEVSLTEVLKEKKEHEHDHLDSSVHELLSNEDKLDEEDPSSLPADDYFSSTPAHAQSPRALSPRVHSPGGLSPRIGSPGGSVRPRINRDDVKRRLMKRRSFGSPSPDLNSSPLRTPPRRSPAPSPKTNEIKVRVQYDTKEAEEERERDAMSVMTGMTDISTESAIVQNAEKINIDLSVGSLIEPEKKGEFGLLNVNSGLKFDFGSKFSLGGLGMGSAGSRDSLGVITKDADVKMGSVGSSESMKMGDVDVSMNMKSALDRLMDDVAGAGASRADDSMTTDDDDYSYDESSNAPISTAIQRSATEPAIPLRSEGNGFMSRSVSGASTSAPPVPPKDNIKNREQLILEKRREIRGMDEEDDEPSFNTSPSGGKQAQRNLGMGRPSRRRSMSTGDAEILSGAAKKRGHALLDVAEVDDGPLADSIAKELNKIVEGPRKTKYYVKEREQMIYASSSEKISHMAGPGDVDAGKAWRTVRRPSDMNEYAKQIKEYRAQQNPGKAYGKVFVKVLGVKGMHLPLPQQPTAITCTLNNGIHFVTTPECQLGQDCRIEQEFELIEHSKLEFTLTMKIRRDPHIIAQYKALTPAPVPAPVKAPAPAPVAVQPPSRGGMRSFFSSSPKKSKEKLIVQPPPPPPPVQPVHRLPENLARYLKPDGTLARAFISFKDIASRCDTRLFETSYPLIGQRVEFGGKFSTLQVGEIVLQLFRLPPLPGIASDQLPQSLEECHRGLRHINWHKVTYFQGTLTQNGGDCRTWRRRQLRVIGANLVAFNDVTKKATATIDLKKAIAVEDDQETRSGSNILGRSSRDADEYDGLYGVERSFRLIFPQDEEIIFFADTDEEKARWLEVLRALVGHIPPHPLWAELLWQRQEELAKRNQSQQSNSTQVLQANGRPQHR